MTRERILQRLPHTTLPPPDLASTPSTARASQEAMMESFLAAWEALGGSAQVFENATAARLGLLLYLRDLPYRQFLSWNLDAVPLPGLRAALHDAGIEVSVPDRRDVDPDISLGLTAADAGLADTGSLVLTLAGERSWLPAVLPIRHVVVLPASRLYPDLSAWLTRTPGPADTGNVLFITGPSESRDIELNPHRGMFGPRYLHLILYRE
ncbi:MAG: hypothetical protein D6775_04955 [Caldilineae bacterium]|nr:MAG: hypothetical protein D6775_04955 [Caldilineae bacterium]